MYSFIYPLPVEKISELAYFFEDSAETARRKPDDNGRRKDRPGLEALKECVKQWNLLEREKKLPKNRFENSRASLFTFLLFRNHLSRSIFQHRKFFKI